MRCSHLVTSLLFLVPLVSSKVTVTHLVEKKLYIDNSCSDRDHWNDDWAEAQDFAEKALKRMYRVETDYDFAEVWERVFGVSVTGSRGKKIAGRRSSD